MDVKSILQIGDEFITVLSCPNRACRKSEKAFTYLGRTSDTNGKNAMVYIACTRCQMHGPNVRVRGNIGVSTKKAVKLWNDLWSESRDNVPDDPDWDEK